MSDEIKKSIGINAKFPSQNAPDFVVLKMGIQVEDFKSWLADQPANEAGWINLEVKRKMDDRGKLSISLDNWKPSEPSLKPKKKDDDAELDEVPF